jgi:hypothetical protein
VQLCPSMGAHIMRITVVGAAFMIAAVVVAVLVVRSLTNGESRTPRQDEAQ